MELAAAVCPLILLCASALIFFRRRLGFGLGLVGNFLPIPWFVWTELGFGEGSWPVFNYVGMPGAPELGLYVGFRVVSVLLVSITGACCIVRLFPARWSFRDSPLRQRTWPSMVFGFAVVATWYLRSAPPYRMPGIVDGVPALVRILSLEKRGLRFRETGVIANRDGKFTRWQQDRRLFQFRFEEHWAGGVLERAPLERINSLVASEALRNHTPRAKTLTAWNAEGWYAVLKDQRLFAFTTEDGLTPPRELVALLQEIEEVPALQNGHAPIQDICFGFCYGPVAALGFVFSNQQCWQLPEGTPDCR